MEMESSLYYQDCASREIEAQELLPNFRRTLKIIGLTTMLTTAGCEGNFPKAQDYIKNLDKADPYMAAGAVIIEKTAKEGAKTEYRGHAGLYENAGEFWLATVNHIFHKMPKDEKLIALLWCGDKNDMLKIELPEKEKFLDFSKTFTIRKNFIGKEVIIKDSIIATSLEDNHSQIRRCIDNDKLKPLRISYKSPGSNQRLGLVDASGKLTIVTSISNKDKSTDLLNTKIIKDKDHKGQIGVVNIVKGRHCKGQSGSSMLVLDNNDRPTGEGVGQWAIKSSPSSCSDSRGGFYYFNKEVIYSSREYK